MLARWWQRILFNATLTWCNSSLKQQTDNTNDDPIKTKFYGHYLQSESDKMKGATAHVDWWPNYLE